MKLHARVSKREIEAFILGKVAKLKPRRREIRLNHRLIQDLNFDSLAIADLGADIETTYNVDVEDEAIADLNYVIAIVEYVYGLIRNAAWHETSEYAESVGSL